MKCKFLFMTVAILSLLIGCSRNDAIADKHVWYQNMKDAIHYGLKSEGATTSDLLGMENNDGETYILYKQGLNLGVASISKSDKGYSWYRNSPYITLKSNDQPFATINFDVKTEDKHSSTVVAGVAYDKKIKKVALYSNTTFPLQYKKINATPSLFYFFVGGSSINSATLHVRDVK